MEVTGQLLFNIGFLYWGILFLSVFLGYLRSNTVLGIHFILSCILLYFGMKYFSLNMPCKGNSNGAGFLFGPIVFVISYTLLRGLYKKIYKFEPDMEAYSSFSRRDNRGLNFMDFLTFFIPSMLSSIVNLSLAN